MEKIYEENGKKKQSFFQQFFNNKGSMIAVIVVAIVAIVGLVAFGFNQISFAADEEIMGEEGADFVAGSKGERIYGASQIDGGNVGFEPFVNGSDGSYVICTEFMKEYGWGQRYGASDFVDDAGLVYLITKLNENLPATTGDEDQDLLHYWLKQTAVWTYMYEVHDKEALGEDDSSRYPYYNKENISTIMKLYSDSNENIVTADGAAGSFWNEYGITAVYDEAVKIGKSSSNINYLINIEGENDKISLSSDGKYYVTSSFSVVANNPELFNSYYVDYSDAPDGTLVYDASSGQPLKNGFADSPTTKFKLMIPVDKVTDENKNFDISVGSEFKSLVEYTSGDYQKIVSNGPILVSDIINVEINYTPDVPDTGMTTAQTIYFIGLIILLGGVGIIYANAKPQENN